MTNTIQERCQAVIHVGEKQVQCNVPNRNHEGDHRNVSQKRIWKQGVTRAAPLPKIVEYSKDYPRTTPEHRKLIKKIAGHWPYMEPTKSNAFMVLAYAKAYGRKHRDLVQDVEKAEEFCHILLEALITNDTGTQTDLDKKVIECAKYFGREDVVEIFGGEVTDKKLGEILDRHNNSEEE